MAQNQLVIPLPSGKNWKTTLFGAVTACGLGLIQSQDPILHVVGQVLSVIGPILMGLFSKDSNVTGGVVQQ